MFVHIGLHHPKDDIRPDMIAAMKHFARVAADQPGNLQVLTVEEDGTRLAGITIWRSRADFEAALPHLRDAIADYPWDDWQTQKTDVFLSEAIFAAGPLEE